MLSHKLLFLLLLTLPPSLAFAGDDPRRDSGLRVPRFVSLKSNEINVRSGPGTRYPILWVYRREGLPVEVVEEFEHWRKIRDAESAGGWVHKGMIDGARHVLVKGKVQILRSDPEDKSAAVLRAQGNVIARLIECEKSWCRVQAAGRKGWLKRKQIWGVYDDEEVKK